MQKIRDYCWAYIQNYLQIISVRLASFLFYYCIRSIQPKTHILSLKVSSSDIPRPGIVMSAEMIEMRSIMLSFCLCRCANSGPFSNASSLASGVMSIPSLSLVGLMIRYACKWHARSNAALPWRTEVITTLPSHVCVTPDCVRHFQAWKAVTKLDEAAYIVQYDAICARNSTKSPSWCLDMFEREIPAPAFRCSLRDKRCWWTTSCCIDLSRLRCRSTHWPRAIITAHLWIPSTAP